MEKPKPQSGSANLLLAVSLLTAFAGITALASAFIAGFVLDQILNSPEAMVMIIVDGAIKSDSAALETNLSWATLGLKAVQDLGWALAVGCFGVGVAVFLRYRRQKAP
jgi:hypothetical protein